MNRIYSILTVLLLMLPFTLTMVSCEEKDGVWDDIETTIDGKYIKNKTINVPAEGGTYVLSTRNYGVPWLLDIKMGMEEPSLLPEGFNYENYVGKEYALDELSFITDITKGYTVTFKPNKTAADRNFIFYLECGDAFSAFTFVQKN